MVSRLVVQIFLSFGFICVNSIVYSEDVLGIQNFLNTFQQRKVEIGNTLFHKSLS